MKRTLARYAATAVLLLLAGAGCSDPSGPDVDLSFSFQPLAEWPRPAVEEIVVEDATIRVEGVTQVGCTDGTPTAALEGSSADLTLRVGARVPGDTCATEARAFRFSAVLTPDRRGPVRVRVLLEARASFGEPSVAADTTVTVPAP